MMLKIRVATMLFGGLVSGGAAAQTSGSISVQDAWARATPPHANAAAIYVTVIDHGAPDRLVGMSTPVAGKAELHETIHDGNVMKMRPVDGLPLSAEKPISLAPGGYHIMLTGLTRPLAGGQTFPLSLRFEKSGTIEATVTVKAAGSAMGMSGGAGMNMGGGAAGDTGGGHDMQHMNMPGVNKP